MLKTEDTTSIKKEAIVFTPDYTIGGMETLLIFSLINVPVIGIVIILNSFLHFSPLYQIWILFGNVFIVSPAILALFIYIDCKRHALSCSK